MLSDLRDPLKRGSFATHDAFYRKYAPGALRTYKQRWADNVAAEAQAR